MFLSVRVVRIHNTETRLSKSFKAGRTALYSRSKARHIVVKYSSTYKRLLTNPRGAELCGWTSIKYENKEKRKPARRRGGNQNAPKASTSWSHGGRTQRQTGLSLKACLP